MERTAREEMPKREISIIFVPFFAAENGKFTIKLGSVKHFSTLSFAANGRIAARSLHNFSCFVASTARWLRITKCSWQGFD